MIDQVQMMAFDKAVVSAPASIANFGPGFDSFGLCLESPKDMISIRRLPRGKREVKVLGKFRVPTNPQKNTASYSAAKLADLCGCGDIGFSLTIRKGMKPGSGIGSSAASSVGGALAMATILGMRDKALVLEASAMGEELVAGSRHFDNVSAVLYGGFTVVCDARTRTIVQVRPPRFQVIVLLPDISIETKKSRDILPREVPLSDAVCNVGWASGMIHAMMKRNVRMIGSYLEDKLVTPYRRSLIPGYGAVHDAAISAGAFGVSIGGSGPTVFAISQGKAASIKAAMVRAFREKSGLKASSFITVPGTGAKVEKVQ